jgi:hypothetical protein
MTSVLEARQLEKRFRVVLTSITLPAAVIGKSVIIRGTPPASPRRALVPLAKGLASITLHDGSLAEPPAPSQV